MRRIFSNGLMVFAGVLSVPGVVAIQSHSIFRDYRLDPRLQSLKRFFQSTNSPAERLSEQFLWAADKHSLDWRLLPSLSFVESGGGKNARNNNLFGWNSGKTAFPSATAAIADVANRLANSKLYKNKSLDGILRTYNPGQSYTLKVKSVMRRICPSEEI